MDIEIVLKPASMSEAADYIKLLKMASIPMVNSTAVAVPPTPAPAPVPVPAPVIAMPTVKKLLKKAVINKPRHGNPWTTRDDNRLMAMRQSGAPHSAIAAALDRTTNAVKFRYSLLCRRWGGPVTVNVR